MNLEFAGRFNNQELLLKEFNYWTIIIRENVVTLGSCIIILNSGKSNLKDVSPEEMAEFPEVCKWFEEKTKALYGAEKWNYCAMMMLESFVHFSAIPRYSKEINMYNRTWTDTEWPKRTTLTKVDVDFDTLMNIKEDMLDK
jgi:diadenosine tetraphosphate (Ap4A) HIT family hydrolase